MRISFIGLGNMGKPLAANILKTGQTLKIFTSKKETEKYFKDLGADIAHSLQEAADCDVICTCVPRPADLISLMMGSKGLYSLLKTGSIHLDFSTIDPQTADEL